jgi:AcrR family transcriptional regulator
VTRAKRQNWSGDPPESDEQARQRLIAAALCCAEAKGLGRTTIADIARQAGVTRPTVYTHFEDRHALFQTAFSQAATRMMVNAHRAMRRRGSAGERAVEAVAHFVLELPKDPCLRLTLTAEGLGEFTSRALLDGGAMPSARAILEPVFESAPELEPHAEEVTEVTVRFALSLLAVPGPRARTPRQLRAFLRRRLLPSIGLARD